MVVTGAAGGIGQALCKTFRRAGYRVVGTDLSRAPNCDAFVAMDLRVLDDMDGLVAAVGPRLDVLVNNAAIQSLASTAEVRREDWEATLAINVTAPFLLSQGLIPQLEKARGCIINVSSIHATLTKPGFVAYATSKAALEGMTRSLAVDLGGRVRVVAIAPAAIETDMLQRGLAKDPELHRRLQSHHPSGAIGHPHDVAIIALSLANGPEFLTGAVVGLDGAIRNRLHDPA